MAQESRNKTLLVYIVITVLLFVLFTARIAYLIIVENDTRKDYQDPQVAEDVVRGDITDRNSNILASQVSTWSVYFRLSAIEDLDYAAAAVSPYLGMSVSSIVSKAGQYTTYALIKDRIDMETADELDSAIKAAGLENQIDLVRMQTRTYSAGFHACQLIGFVNREGTGAEGLEYYYDDILSPYPQLGEDITYGADLELTIDLDIQYLADVQVQNIAYENDPDYIMALVADAKTGEILAMSSYPWYDLNYYNVSSQDERLNRCAAYSYEPGSVFKVFTLAKCIDAGIDTDTPFICDGSETFTVGDSSFTINCHTPHGEVDARNMISKSCNGAIASWCLQLSDEDFYSYLRLLGFGSKQDLPLPGLTTGFLASPSDWSSRTKATLAFGQEINVNALQIVRAASALANDGVMKDLSIVRSIKDHQGNVLWQAEPDERQVISSAAARKILSYMESAAEEGTASKASVDSIRVAAKTGTAEIINQETGSYADGTNLASTLALVPADNPQYIIYFAVSAPKGSSVWGADIAAPACAALIRGLMSQGKLISSQAGTIQVS